MNTLSSPDTGHRNTPPITALEYHDVPRDLRGCGAHPEAVSAGLEPEKKPPRVSLSEEELGQRLLQVAATAAQEAEARLNQQHQREMQAERARIGEAIVQFQGERTGYYSRVEPELVNLVLAVAGRILHREAQVDRMLLAALAKIADQTCSSALTWWCGFVRMPARSGASILPAICREPKLRCWKTPSWSPAAVCWKPNWGRRTSASTHNSRRSKEGSSIFWPNGLSRDERSTFAGLRELAAALRNPTLAGPGAAGTRQLDRVCRSVLLGGRILRNRQWQRALLLGEIVGTAVQLFSRCRSNARRAFASAIAS